MAKFHENILNPSENIAKSFRGGATFLTHTIVCILKYKYFPVFCILNAFAKMYFRLYFRYV